MLNIEKFSFKNYSFRFNPSTFSITQQRRMKNFPMPYGKTATQDLGFEPIMITGEGELIESPTNLDGFGAPSQSIMEQYQKLWELMQQKNSGPLTIPALSPIYCYFKHLEITGRAGPKVLRYKFTFVQDCERELLPLIGQKNFTIAQYGDTLDIIAIKNNLSFSEILSYNPSLTTNLDIAEGSLIWLN